MISIAFKMKLKPGARQEYKRRHDALWPEMNALLKAGGVHEYSIFHDAETDILFAVQKVNEGERLNVQQKGVLQEWWDYMADLMEVNPDNSPVMVELEQLFKLH
jgi:L-rhamnose mutarotase